VFRWAWARAAYLLAILLLLLSIQTVNGATSSPVPVAKTGAQPQALVSAASTTLHPSREIFGYATAASLGDPTFGYPSWNFDLLGTVAFFAIHVQYNGILVADSTWNVWNSSVLTGLVATAHAHGVKVVVTIVGPHIVADQCDALYNGATTVAKIVNQVQLKGVDGVNIDYEGQLAQCKNNNPALNQSNQSLLTNFARQMREGLDAARPGYYLSIATYSGSAAGNDGYFNIPGLNQYVDSFFVMAYDMDYGNALHAPLSCTGRLGLKCLSPVSPLTNYYYNDTISMAQYASVVGAGKTILGQPYYGRVACVASPVAHAIPISNLSAATYLDAVGVATSPDVKLGTFKAHRDANDPTGRDRWDTWYDTKLRCWREMYWGDTTQLGTRYNFVNQANLRGVGFWTLNYGGGSPELWGALQNHFVKCASVSASASPASAAMVGTAISITAVSSGCQHADPLYEFWALAPGAHLYTQAQAYSTNPVFNWSTSGLAPGTYRMNVWVRDASSPGAFVNPSGSYDAYNATLLYTLTAGCPAVGVAAAPAAAAMVTMPVFLTASSPNCPNPLYEFWVLAPGATLYTKAQGYGTAPTFNWNTSGLAKGTYRFSIWVRDASSAGTFGNASGRYDAYNINLLYTLTVGCPAVSEIAIPTSAAMVAVPVTVIANAPGCPAPLYEFWVLAPGASLYTKEQTYGSSAVFNWNTTGLATGTYRFTVWVRDAGSIGISGNAYGRWDAYSTNLAYTLTAACPSVSVSASPLATASAGTTITISPSAPGCPNPLYEFWVLAPGASFYTLEQAYGPGAFSWNTAGFAQGTYRINVWVRDNSSAGVFGNANGRWDAYASLIYTLT
jgi:Glycosyl hydrolases family 18